MGLRSPQEMQKVQIQKEPGVRFNGGAAPQIDNSFIVPAMNMLKSKEDAALKFAVANEENEVEALTVAAKGELAQAQGMNAYDLAKKKRKEIKEALAKRMDSAPEYLRPYVQKVHADKINSFESFVTPRVYEEIGKVKNKVYKENVANHTNGVVENSANPEEFQKGLASLADSAEAFVRNKYGEEPVLIKEHKELAISDAIKRSIETQAKSQNLVVAKQLLKDYESYMRPADRNAARETLEKQQSDTKNKNALLAAKDAITRYPNDPVARNQYLQDVSESDELFQRSAQIVDREIKVRKQAEEKQADEAKARAYKAIDEGKSFDEVSSLIMQVPGEHRSELFRYIDSTNKGQNIITDPAFHDELFNLFSSDPQAAKDLNLHAKAKGKLDGQDLKTFEDWQAQIRKADTDEVARSQLGNDRLVTEELRRTATELKIYNPSERAKFLRLGRERYHQLLQENPKADRKTIRSVLAREALEKGATEVQRKKWFGLSTTTKRTANEELVKKNLAPKIPPADIATLKKERPNWTEEQINAYFKYLIEVKGLYK